MLAILAIGRQVLGPGGTMKESYEVEARVWGGWGPKILPAPKAWVYIETMDQQFNIQIETERNGTIRFSLKPPYTLEQAKEIATDIAECPDTMAERLKEKGIQIPLHS